MDTLFGQNGRYEISSKACEFLVVMLVFAGLLYSHGATQPAIYANDLIANTVIRTPELVGTTKNIIKNENPQILKQEFLQRISLKYKNYKILDDGIVHARLLRYYNGRPVKINVIEMNQKVAQNYELKPATASSNTLQYKTTLRTIAARTQAIAAINGGFFKPQSGVPLGTLLIDGKMYTGPIYNRAALGIFESG